jgi:hypothetical protein
MSAYDLPPGYDSWLEGDLGMSHQYAEDEPLDEDDEIQRAIECDQNEWIGGSNEPE